MIRKIIHIDEEKCNGCGLCAEACHEGAIDIVDGKAKLVRENFCDGFGDCLPNCPMGAITFEEREAPAYDEAAVLASRKGSAKEADPAQGTAGGSGSPAAENSRAASDITGGNSAGAAGMKEGKQMNDMHEMHHEGGCPGSRMMQFARAQEDASGNGGLSPEMPRNAVPARPSSQLAQWPCQIKLLPPKAPFFEGAKLLIAADCTAYAYAGMHEDLMKGKVTVIGCPKLDDVDYTEKLTEIISGNDIKSVTIVRMEVPCCGGLQRAAEQALKNSGKFIPWQVVTISRDGRILDM